MKRLTIFLLVFVFFFAQCKKTDEILPNLQQPERIENKQIEPLVTTLNKDEVLNDTTFQKMISGMGTLENDNLLLKSGTTNPVTEIKLIWDKVKKISTTGYMSYTFLIYQPNQNGNFSNLILEYKGLKHNIIKLDYFPDPKYLKLSKAGIISLFKGKIFATRYLKEALKLKSTECITVVSLTKEEIPIKGNSHLPFAPKYKVKTFFQYNTYCFSSSNSYKYEETTQSIENDLYSNNNDPYTNGGTGDYYINTTGTPGNPDSYTNIVNPNLDINISEQILSVENELEIEIIEPSDDPKTPYLIDLKTYLTSSSAIASDGSGGYLYICKGRYIYYRNGQWYAYLEGNNQWYKANLATTKLSNEITQLIGTGVLEIGYTVASCIPVAESAYILWNGTDFRGYKSNAYLASGFLLLDIVPGASAAKVLKPVANALGSSLKYFFKYGDYLLDLVKVDGILKFTDGTIKKLANEAMKNKGSANVLLGKWTGSSDSYEVVARNKGWCHFDLGDDYRNLDELTSKTGEMWKVNKQFLDDCKAQNKTIFFNNNPYNPEFAKGGYLDEINYIQSPNFGGSLEWDRLNNMYKVVFKN